MAKVSTNTKRSQASIPRFLTGLRGGERVSVNLNRVVEVRRDGKQYLVTYDKGDVVDGHGTACFWTTQGELKASGFRL